MLPTCCRQILILQSRKALKNEESRDLVWEQGENLESKPFGTQVDEHEKTAKAKSDSEILRPV